MTTITRESLADSTGAIVAATATVQRALRQCGLTMPEAHVTCLLIARLMRESTASVQQSDHGAIADFIEQEAAAFREIQAGAAS